ncbi:MAG: transposase [Chloroflexota bacterium]
MTTLPTTLLSTAARAPDSLLWRVDDTLWATLCPILRDAGSSRHPRLSAADDRRFMNGLIWLLRTGAQWKALPEEFGPRSTLHARFQEWVRAGAFDQALEAVSRRYGNQQALAAEDRTSAYTFRRLLSHWDREPANFKAFTQLAAMLTLYRKARRAPQLAGERLAG